MEGMQSPIERPPTSPARRNPVLRLLGHLAWVVPAGPVLTLLLDPFWSWLETATGWESIGHSGPAGWCFLAVWAALLVLAGLLSLLAHRGQG